MDLIKKILANKYVRNKYFITSFIFLLYILFLDDLDIFMIVSQNRKLNKLEAHKLEMTKQLIETRSELKMLNNTNSLEAYARSKKFFKRDDEDIFVITYE